MPSLTCLAIATIANGATFRESVVELLGLQETFLQTAKLAVKTFAGTDVIPADAELRRNLRWHARPLELVCGYCSSTPQLSDTGTNRRVLAVQWCLPCVVEATTWRSIQSSSWCCLGFKVAISAISLSLHWPHVIPL